MVPVLLGDPLVAHRCRVYWPGPVDPIVRCPVFFRRLRGDLRRRAVPPGSHRPRVASGRARGYCPHPRRAVLTVCQIVRSRFTSVSACVGTPDLVAVVRRTWCSAARSGRPVRVGSLWVGSSAPAGGKPTRYHGGAGPGAGKLRLICAFGCRPTMWGISSPHACGRGHTFRLSEGASRHGTCDRTEDRRQDRCRGEEGRRERDRFVAGRS